jgi:hypothetical protein
MTKVYVLVVVYDATSNYEIMKTVRAKIDGFGFTTISCSNC